MLKEAWHVCSLLVRSERGGREREGGEEEGGNLEDPKNFVQYEVRMC